MARTWISVKELAERTGVHPNTIWRELRETGHVMGIKGVRIRKTWVIPLAPIEKLEEGAA